MTCNMGCGGHNVALIRDNIGIRKLTPRECFNLQGFPENYKLPKLSDNKLYKLPLSLAKLVKLKTLRLTNNVIKTLPKELNHMQAITKFE